uniref:limulus clotting factor C n=1 Tax=Panagrellus redivivus TaxID=6233 RepID=A0A7E4ZT63_PANRE
MLHMMQSCLGILILFTAFDSIRSANLQCGQTPIHPNLNNGIVGGHRAQPFSWPWQTLIYSGPSVCSGSIVADQWIISAAHCFYRINEDRVKVYSGVFNINYVWQSIKVRKIYLHPKYGSRADWNNDIALLELEHPIAFNSHVQPVCLPSNDSSVVVPPNMAWTAGWGYTHDRGELNNILRQVHLPFVDFNTCKIRYTKYVTETMHICAGKEGKDACQGDSGGPLVVKSSDGPWFQYGITSFGGQCGAKDQPGVFTRVSNYCSWIETTTAKNVTCQSI